MRRILMEVNTYLIGRQVDQKTIYGTIGCKIQNMVIGFNFFWLECLE